MGDRPETKGNVRLTDGAVGLDGDLKALREMLERQDKWRQERAQLAWWRRPFAP
ncbi:MAG: hypothetical protein ACRDI2_08195 [Chloroflexota bacterium]